MVTGERIQSRDNGLVIRIDGTRQLSEQLAALNAVCDRAEDQASRGTMVVYVSGVPGKKWADDLPITLVSRWERGLRRLERLPAVSIAVADGDCGGAALDALLVTDYRIMSASARLLIPAVAGATWPGMTLYRLVRQAGPGPVRRAALLGLPIDAEAALAMGVVDKLASDVTVALADAVELADTLQGAEIAIRRQLMLDAPATSFEDALGVHLAACDRALRAGAAGVQR